MKLRVIYAGLISALSLCDVSLARAVSLSDWVGSNVSALSTSFDRYDVDLTTGKMQGPIKGHLELQRPGLLTLDMQDQHIQLNGDYLEVSACANCKPTYLSAVDAIGKPLLQLIGYGTNAGDLFGNAISSSVDIGGTANSNASYSLASIGFDQYQFTLWSYKDQPTVVEINLTPGVKTILQFYGLQRSLLNGGVKK